MLRFPTRAGFLRAAGTALAASLVASRASAQSRRDAELFEITDSETATIDGRSGDTPIVGGPDLLEADFTTDFDQRTEAHSPPAERAMALSAGRPGPRPGPSAREVDISHALKPGQDGADMARTFTISGLAEAPRVTLNGHPANVRPIGQAFQVLLR